MDLLLNPPSVTTLLILGLVSVVLLIALTALIVNMPAKEKPAMKFLAPYRKALVGLVVGAVTTYLAGRNIDLNQSLQAAIGAVVTALSVFLIPNETPAP